ncbi:MAG: non-canonical purine NTP pyrophosphatase, partial [Firmicutes bacterium]|nr:non-canonical purine NTP pyrophosphatase [Bacillota bacterium]
GICPGRIAFEERGEGGFGYDKIFMPENLNRSFAELGVEVKNEIGHRARALARLEELLDGEI